MTRQVIPFVRGGTFSLGGSVTLPSGTWSGVCKVCTEATDGTLTEIDSMTVTVTPPDTPGDPHLVLVVGAAENTTVWPVGKLVSNVMFVDTSEPQVKLPSRKFVIDVDGNPSR